MRLLDETRTARRRRSRRRFRPTSRSTAHDVPIPLNERVLSYVELFQGRLRPFIEDGLQRGSQYLPMIQNVFRAEGLPLDLAYVPLIESAFKPNALSRANAEGVWQFMRATALENGLRHDWYVDERSDPEKATHAAAKYLKTLSRHVRRRLAPRAGVLQRRPGPGAARDEAHRRRRTSGTLSRSARCLPRETREYVPMILAAIVIARNPAQYGFDVQPDGQPIGHETVKLPGPVDLRRVAEWTGASIDAIQAAEPGAAALDDAGARRPATS